MRGILEQLSTFDVRGYVIVSAIVLCFLVSLLTTFAVRARYAGLAGDLSEKAGVVPFESPVLRRIVQEVIERIAFASMSPRVSLVTRQWSVNTSERTSTSSRSTGSGPAARIASGATIGSLPHVCSVVMPLVFSQNDSCARRLSTSDSTT